MFRLLKLFQLLPSYEHFVRVESKYDFCISDFNWIPELHDYLILICLFLNHFSLFATNTCTEMALIQCCLLEIKKINCGKAYKHCTICKIMHHQRGKLHSASRKFLISAGFMFGCVWTFKVETLKWWEVLVSCWNTLLCSWAGLFLVFTAGGGWENEENCHQFVRYSFHIG